MSTPEPFEAPVQRPNPLATLSLVLGILTTAGQCFAVCLTLCTPIALGLPTALTLFTGWYGLRQARETGVGLVPAVTGLTLGVVNFAINVLWLLGYVLVAIAIVTSYGR